jgi:hypothetical protein
VSGLLSLRNVLIAFAALLAIGLGVETDWGEAFGKPQISLRETSARHDAAGVLPDFALQSEASTYAQIAERPLLNPNRKPAPTQVVAIAPEPPKPQVRRGLYQLVGVTDLGEVKIAQVREIASNRVKSVREGDELQEMKVSKVGAASVTLAFAGETDVLELAKFTASGRVPAPPPPPAPVAAPQPVAQQPSPQPAAPPRPVAQTAPAPAGQPFVGIGAVPAPASQRVFANGLVVPEGARDPTQPREVISVGEMLERRRLARQQAGGQ